MKEIFNYKSTLLATAHAMRNSLKLVGRKHASGGDDGINAFAPIKPETSSGSSAASIVLK